MTLLTRREVAGLLRISTRTLDRLCNERELTPVRVGRGVRFAKADVERYIRRGRETEGVVA